MCVSVMFGSLSVFDMLSSVLVIGGILFSDTLMLVCRMETALRGQGWVGIPKRMWEQ